MFDPARLVFVDETAANTKMVRLSGRCPRGERLIGRVPQGHWKTITFVAALRLAYAKRLKRAALRFAICPSTRPTSIP